MRPSQAYAVLQAALKANLAVMLWGGPGIGKSDVVRRLAMDNERDLRDVRISQLDSVDLRGIPQVREGITYWNPPSFLPRDPDSQGILFLDEINSGSTGTMAAAYQLVLDRALGEYRLPPGWVVFAAGNRIQDRAIVNAMPAPLRNRFIHVEMETHLDDWCAWALKRAIHNDVIGFVRYRPTLLNEFDVGKDATRMREASQKLKDANAFASPRSWHFLSRMLDVGIPADVEYETYGSVVGEGAAAEFIAYKKYASAMPNLDQVLIDPKRAPVPEEPATLYATVTGLASKATAENFERVVTYTDRLQPEFGIMCVKDAITRNEKICNTKAFHAWAVRNSNVIL
jgi:hypothetical protein